MDDCVSPAIIHFINRTMDCSEKLVGFSGLLFAPPKRTIKEYDDEFLINIEAEKYIIFLANEKFK